MRQVANALIAIAWLAMPATDSLHAQSPGTVAVGFRNKTNLPVIVQGYSVVNGSIRRGTLITINAKGMGFENNVPAAGFRFYNVHDANQPSSRILLLNARVVIPARDVIFSIVPSPTNPNQVILVPDP